jgi:hypothetical protein
VAVAQERRQSPLPLALQVLLPCLVLLLVLPHLYQEE